MTTERTSARGPDQQEGPRIVLPSNWTEHRADFRALVSHFNSLRHHEQLAEEAADRLADLLQNHPPRRRGSFLEAVRVRGSKR